MFIQNFDFMEEEQHNEEIRWEQRFASFSKALTALSLALDEVLSEEYDNQRPIVKEMFRDSVIQRFEFTFELAWKLMKDYCNYCGFDVNSPNAAIKQSLQMGLIEDRQWMEMLKSRNVSTHTYDEEMADEVLLDIEVYYNLFESFHDVMEGKLNKEK